MNIFTQFFSEFFSSPVTPQQIEQDFIRRESRVGRSIFGNAPYGVKRDFFCLDAETWIWHEENEKCTKTTKYKIKSTEIIKSVNSGQYERVSLKEAKRFVAATRIYSKRINKEIYDKIALA